MARQRESGLAVTLADVAPAQRRQRVVIEAVDSVSIVVDGQRYHQFSSNDYLGLAGDPRLLQSYAEAAQNFGSGSRAAPLVNGYLAPHHDLTRQLADWLERDDALLFSSGFAANASALAALTSCYDQVLLDKLSHASLIDGARAGARAGDNNWRRFRHQDFTHLTQLLAKDSTARAKTSINQLVVSEGVFSMDGDTTNIAELLHATRSVSPTVDIMMDDAHALGVLGAGGRGIGGDRAQGDVGILTATFGKALGVSGAGIAGSNELIDFLVQHSREYRYSTAFPAAQAAAVSRAIRIVQSAEGETLRARLAENIHEFREGAAERGINLLPSTSAIQGIVIGEDAAALRVSDQLREQGFWCVPIRPPTVPPGTARLRITLTAAHQPAVIHDLLTALTAALAAAE